MSEASATKESKEWLVSVKHLTIPELGAVQEAYKVLPPDITKVTSRDLGRYHQAFVMMAVHADYECSGMDARVTELEDLIDKKRAILMSSFDEGGEKWRLESKVGRNVEYRELTSALTKASIRHTLLKSLAEGYQTQADMVSREITRRMAVMERERRQHQLP